MRTRIAVSPEMTAFVGSGPLPTADRPARAIGFSFRLARGTFAIHPDSIDVDGMADADLAFFVCVQACHRIFGAAPADPAAWHLPSDMRAIALAIVDCPMSGEAGATLRLAKCIELLCATFGKLTAKTLVPLDSDGLLSAAEAGRIAAAHRLIDERWHEQLTLASIARACGLNRAKLTRGFRATFAMSVTEAIVDRRLGGARQLLLATDLPVSSIGFRCGYRNNASFTRAFSRRFGIAPTQLRGRCAA